LLENIANKTLHLTDKSVIVLLRAVVK